MLHGVGVGGFMGVGWGGARVLLMGVGLGLFRGEVGVGGFMGVGWGGRVLLMGSGWDCLGVRWGLGLFRGEVGVGIV